MSNPVVIDISHWQDDPIDWAKLKANGTVGVIHKATEGTGYTDPKLFSRASAAIKAGLCWSTYHFLKAGNPTGQMDYYLKTVGPKQGERMCIDHEEKATLAELEQAVTYLKSKRPDIQITIYSGHLIKDQLGSKRSAVLAENTSLWLAQYTSGSPSWPTGTWPQWSLWQYTDKGSAAGINGSVDANKWNGDPANIAAWFGSAGVVTPPEPVPPPEPTPEVKEVLVAITQPEGVKITVTINGEPIAS